MENKILNHDYGYGEGKQNIKKLKLKNINELKMYIKDVIENIYGGNFTHDIVSLHNDNVKSKIVIKSF